MSPGVLWRCTLLPIRWRTLFVSFLTNFYRCDTYTAGDSGTYRKREPAPSAGEKYGPRLARTATVLSRAATNCRKPKIPAIAAPTDAPPSPAMRKPMPAKINPNTIAAINSTITVRTDHLAWRLRPRGALPKSREIRATKGCHQHTIAMNLSKFVSPRAPAVCARLSTIFPLSVHYMMIAAPRSYESSVKLPRNLLNKDLYPI